MIIEDNHIDRIIARSIANEASQEDLLLLREWMDQSRENKRYVENIQLLHDRALASVSPVKVDTLKAWERVSAQLDSPVQVTTSTPRKTILLQQRKWTKVAASIALIVGISSLLYYFAIGFGSDITRYNIASTNVAVNKTIAGNIHLCLNKGTTIEVVENKKEKTRELQLSGEALIEVKHTDDTQLIVKAGETLIKDIGTTFNVKASPKSSTIEVFVESGEVSFFTNDQSGIKLTKGETGIFDKQTKLFRTYKISDPNLMSYKTRKFIFTNIPLSQAVKEINAVYPKSISFADSLIGNRTLNVTFDNENIDAIADIISETMGLTVSKTNNGYILR